VNKKDAKKGSFLTVGATRVYQHTNRRDPITPPNPYLHLLPVAVLSWLPPLNNPLVKKKIYKSALPD
jgi:hypothetical protein